MILPASRYRPFGGVFFVSCNDRNQKNFCIAISTSNFTFDPSSAEGRKKSRCPTPPSSSLFPFLQVSSNLTTHLIFAHTPPKRIHEFTTRIHKIKEDGMINQVIIPCFRFWWGREIDATFSPSVNIAAEEGNWTN